MERELEEQMKKAAAAEDFEKAAQFRDALDDLRRTTQKTKKFPRVPYTLPVAMDPQRDLAELARALGLAGRPGAHRGLRHFQHQRHLRRRFDGQLSRRQARPLQLPALPHEDGDRARTISRAWRRPCGGATRGWRGRRPGRCRI